MPFDFFMEHRRSIEDSSPTKEKHLFPKYEPHSQMRKYDNTTSKFASDMKKKPTAAPNYHKETENLPPSHHVMSSQSFVVITTGLEDYDSDRHAPSRCSDHFFEDTVNLQPRNLFPHKSPPKIISSDHNMHLLKTHSQSKVPQRKKFSRKVLIWADEAQASPTKDGLRVSRKKQLEDAFSDEDQQMREFLDLLSQGAF